MKGVNSGFKLRLGKTDRPFAIIHGEDLARALVTCLDVDHPSGATWYVTDGINHTNRELGEIVEHALGKKSIWITIPETLIPTIGSINQLWGKVTGKTPFLTAEKLNEFMQPSWACDDSSFRQATGFKPQIDLQQGMMGTIKWYKENGWL